MYSNVYSDNNTSLCQKYALVKLEPLSLLLPSIYIDIMKYTGALLLVYKRRNYSYAYVSGADLDTHILRRPDQFSPPPRSAKIMYPVHIQLFLKHSVWTYRKDVDQFKDQHKVCVMFNFFLDHILIISTSITMTDNEKT